MGIPNSTVVQLQTEGLDGVENLADFDKETIAGIASCLRCPVGRIADPDPEQAAAGATIPTPAFVFGAKSQQRLIVSTKLHLGGNLSNMYIILAVITESLR
jgi:hypothetical protein